MTPISRCVLCLVLTVALAAPGLAQTVTIPAGIDLFKTPADGGTSAEVTLPPDFLCEGFPGDSPTIAFKGIPLITSPSNVLGGTDTVVYRPDELTLEPQGSGKTAIQIVGLSLEGTQNYVACGQSWKVRACLDGDQQVGSMTVTLNGSGTGGTFSASLPIDVAIYFVAGNLVQGPLATTIDLETSNAYWAVEPGSGGTTYSGSVQLSNCNGSPSGPSYPGTGGFFPGWHPSDPVDPPPCSNPPCTVPIPHDDGGHAHITIPPVPPGPGPGCPRPTDLKIAFKSTSPYFDGSRALAFDLHPVHHCQIEVIDLAVRSTNGDACKASHLDAREGNSGLGYTIVSSAPCVLTIP